ncbi:hypothetical protein CRENBAI_010042 [Crenichthys baileyi]|uniref:Uncharacterized protein n=1 Tax=Crenichthys baileyi TaxID=28760 RepID=A0AAV9S695_9TELE
MIHILGPSAFEIFSFLRLISGVFISLPGKLVRGKQDLSVLFSFEISGETLEQNRSICRAQSDQSCRRNPVCAQGEHQTSKFLEYSGFSEF